MHATPMPLSLPHSPTTPPGSGICQFPDTLVEAFRRSFNPGKICDTAALPSFTEPPKTYKCPQQLREGLNELLTNPQIVDRLCFHNPSWNKKGIEILLGRSEADRKVELGPDGTLVITLSPSCPIHALCILGPALHAFVPPDAAFYGLAENLGGRKSKVDESALFEAYLNLLSTLNEIVTESCSARGAFRNAKYVDEVNNRIDSLIALAPVLEEVANRIRIEPPVLIEDPSGSACANPLACLNLAIATTKYLLPGLMAVALERLHASLSDDGLSASGQSSGVRVTSATAKIPSPTSVLELAATVAVLSTNELIQHHFFPTSLASYAQAVIITTRRISKTGFADLTGEKGRQIARRLDTIALWADQYHPPDILLDSTEPRRTLETFSRTIRAGSIELGACSETVEYWRRKGSKSSFLNELYLLCAAELAVLPTRDPLDPLTVARGLEALSGILWTNAEIAIKVQKTLLENQNDDILQRFPHLFVAEALLHIQTFGCAHFVENYHVYMPYLSRTVGAAIAATLDDLGNDFGIAETARDYPAMAHTMGTLEKFVANLRDLDANNEALKYSEEKVVPYRCRWLELRIDAAIDQDDREKILALTNEYLHYFQTNRNKFKSGTVDDGPAKTAAKVLVFLAADALDALAVPQRKSTPAVKAILTPIIEGLKKSSGPDLSLGVSQAISFIRRESSDKDLPERQEVLASFKSSPLRECIDALTSWFSRAGRTRTIDKHLGKVGIAIKNDLSPRFLAEVADSIPRENAATLQYLRDTVAASRNAEHSLYAVRVPLQAMLGSCEQRAAEIARATLDGHVGNGRAKEAYTYLFFIEHSGLDNSTLDKSCFADSHSNLAAAIVSRVALSIQNASSGNEAKDLLESASRDFAAINNAALNELWLSQRSVFIAGVTEVYQQELDRVSAHAPEIWASSFDGFLEFGRNYEVEEIATNAAQRVQQEARKILQPIEQAISTALSDNKVEAAVTQFEKALMALSDRGHHRLLLSAVKENLLTLRIPIQEQVKKEALDIPLRTTAVVGRTRVTRYKALVERLGNPKLADAERDEAQVVYAHLDVIFKRELDQCRAAVSSLPNLKKSYLLLQAAAALQKAPPIGVHMENFLAAVRMMLLASEFDTIGKIVGILPTEDSAPAVDTTIDLTARAAAVLTTLKQCASFKDRTDALLEELSEDIFPEIGELRLNLEKCERKTAKYCACDQAAAVLAISSLMGAIVDESLNFERMLKNGTQLEKDSIDHLEKILTDYGVTLTYLESNPTILPEVLSAAVSSSIVSCRQAFRLLNTKIERAFD